MEHIDSLLWVIGIMPVALAGIGIAIVKRSRGLAIALLSAAAGFAAIDVALVIFFSGVLV